MTGELSYADVKDIKTEQSEGYREIKPEKQMSVKELNDAVNDEINKAAKDAERQDEPAEGEMKGLSEEDKLKIKDETNWSDEIIDAIGSNEEYEIYENAGLNDAEINGRKCLLRTDIDWNQKDVMGRTNLERTEQGLSPIDKNGKVFELHHIGQHSDSPLAELTMEEHRGKGNDAILHNKTKETEIDRQIFAQERSDHWIARASMGR